MRWLHTRLFYPNVNALVILIYIIVRITFQYTRKSNYILTTYNCYCVIKIKNNFTASLK
jgi:hypothetical protein